MPFLRQSTSQVIRFGPCLDIGDAVTEETALTLAQADMRLSKDGGAFAQKNAAGNATHDSDGWYSTTLNATDTDTVGELILNVHQPANMLPVWQRWWVLEEATYDALFGAAAAGFNASGLVTLAAVTHTGAVIPTVTTLTGHTAQTGDSFARLGAPAGASVSADIADVPTVSEFNARTLVAASYFDPAADTVATVTSVTNAVTLPTIPANWITASGIAAAAITSSEAPNLDAAVSSRATPAQVNTEVVDVLTVDTVTLPGQVAPGNTPTIRDILGWLYKAFRNKKTQTDTTWSLFDDAGTVVDSKATVSDSAGTFTKEEIVTGP